MACIPQNQYNPSLHEIISTHNTEAECNDNCGVCCLPDGSCVDNTQTECSAAGGSWNAGVTCEDVICPFPSPSPSPSPSSPPSVSPSAPPSTPPNIQCETNEDCSGENPCCDNGTCGASTPSNVYNFPEGPPVCPEDYNYAGDAPGDPETGSWIYCCLPGYSAVNPLTHPGECCPI